MKQQTLKYLQKDQVGKVIATGLATLFMTKPQKPVRYLAEWLKTYSRNEKQMARLANQQKQKQGYVKVYEKEVQQIAHIQQQNTKKQNKAKQIKNQFRELISKHEYHSDLLQESLGEFLQKNIGATGVYIAQLNYPPKTITEEDTDENAHLEITADKILNYIGSSTSHKQLVRGKILKQNQGITANSFSLLQQIPAPVIGEDGQQIPQPPKQKYIYVPNVVKNEGMYYFKIPKLGSYLAVPIICHQYLTQTNFDIGLKQKLQYLHQVEQLQKAKKEQLQELAKQKQDLEKKVSELTQKNNDPAQLETIKAELAEVEASIIQKQKQNIEQKEQQLVSNKKHYVICADTLGKDKQFSQEQINFVVDFANHYKECWQKRQKQLLKNDINNQIQSIKVLEHPPQTYKQQLQRIQELSQQQQKQVAAITEENKKNHRQLDLQLVKFKTVINTNPFYLEAFKSLNKRRVVKYRGLIQHLLFFLGYNKSQVNQPNTARLNWRQVRHKYINQANFKKIFDYDPLGPKKGQYYFYNKTPFLTEAFDKFQQDEVFKYNISLGAILIFLKKVLQLRQLDYQIRNTKYETENKARLDILAQNQKINTKFQQQLQKHKQSLPEQEAQIFNVQAWKQQFFTKYPLHDVPQQITKDIDNDMGD